MAIVGFTEKFLDTETFIEKFLKKRNIKEKAKDFIEADFQKLTSPFELENIEKAIEVLDKTIKDERKIMIVGHDDADGITSVAIMTMFLEKIYNRNNIFPYLPSSLDEGLGLKAIQDNELLERENIALIITVDSSVRNVEETDYLKSRGIDVIITDHHLLPPELPRADAVINPKMGNYKDEMIAGVGVAYQFIIAYLQKNNVVELLNNKDFMDTILIHTGIGTICDRVPMTHDNRIIVKNAYDLIISKKNKKFEEFFNVIAEEFQFESYNKVLNFLAGVYKSNKCKNGTNEIFDYFINGKNDLNFLRQICRKMVENNNEIKYFYDDIIKAFDMENYEKSSFAYYDEKLKYSHISALASKLTEFLGKPVVIIAKEKDYFVAEARGPKSFNLVESFDYFKNLFVTYGGHRQAAGFSVATEENVQKFVHSYEDFFEINNFSFDCNENNYYDFIVQKKEEIFEIIDEIKKLIPFTRSFNLPRFKVSDTAEVYCFDENFFLKLDKSECM